MNRRRQDLEHQLEQHHKLLREYEDLLRLESDPREIARIEYNIEREQKTIARFEHQLAYGTDDKSLPAAQRLRQSILHNVRSTWIEGVLEQSLHKGIWLQLGLEYQPQVVSRRTVYTGNEERPIPSDKKIEAVFAEAGRKLLILGAPGAGKTMLLLELAKALVAQAEADSAAPLPFVFNLSSWALASKPLIEWLVEELHQQYQLSRQVAGEIVAEERLILLLDGLDEVHEEARPNCVEAINDFQGSHQVELVVCSRIDEYEALEGVLNVGTAVRILPLTNEQVDEFVSREGLALTAVRATLEHDPILRELTQTPLFLNVMVLAYSEKSLAEFSVFDSIEARRQNLYLNYIEWTLKHRSLDTKVPLKSVAAYHCLSQIAANMLTHQQSVFYIEHLQPTWLPDKSKKTYRMLMGLLLLGPIGMLLGSLLGTIIIIFGGWPILLAITVLLGLMIAMLLGLKTDRFDKIKHTGIVRWAYPTDPLWIRKSIIVALLSAPFFKILTASQLFGAIDGLLIGLLYGLNKGLLRMEFREHKKTARRVGVSERAKYELLLMLPFVILSGLVTWSIVWTNEFATIIELIIVAFVGPAGMLLVAKHQGLVGVQQITLHFLLYRAHVLPHPFFSKKLTAFFDAMAERLIFRRVGGGWIFIHRTLMEYLAELTPEEIEDLGEEA